MNPLVFALPGNESFAQGIARSLGADLGRLEMRHFPDGESLVRLATNPGGRGVVIACTLHRPDAKLMALLLAADAARQLGATSVGLAAPYLAYMRQDARFRAGEAISAATHASVLSSHFDWLVTVDPHLHRYHALAELFRIPAAVVPAAPLLAEWIVANVELPLLIGPDEESRQWVDAIAEQAKAPALTLEKTRLDDRRVRIAVPDLSGWREHTPIVVDDIISTGGTQIQVLGALADRGARPPICLAVHAVFAEWALWGLLEAGAARLVTTNTIPHGTNAIDVAPAVGAACRAMLDAAARPVRRVS